VPTDFLCGPKAKRDGPLVAEFCLGEDRPGFTAIDTKAVKKVEDKLNAHFATFNFMHKISCTSL
jgi:hypothetical protein